MKSRSKSKSRRLAAKDHDGRYRTKKKTVPYRSQWGGAFWPRHLPTRVEAVFQEGLRDPGGLKGLRLGTVRAQADVDHALALYPLDVVMQLYPGNFR